MLVGRPNVGKSTLFNRLTGTRRSIVDGHRRDHARRDYASGNLGTDRFDLTDTGGIVRRQRGPAPRLVVERGQRALQSADLIVMVVDGREGLIPGDEEIAAAARDTGKPIILAINKMDDRRARAGALELYRLGFDTVVEISAEHGDSASATCSTRSSKSCRSVSRTGAACEDRERREPEPAAKRRSRSSAGPTPASRRSSTACCSEERMIVSDVPGTTRDSVDSLLHWHRRQFRIVDTAGIRRPGKVSKSGQVETLSVMLARRAIERADVVVLVIDATRGADRSGRRDRRCGEGRRPRHHHRREQVGPDERCRATTPPRSFDENLRYQLKFLDFAPILHISAATGERTPKLLEMVDKVAAAARTRVPTGELNRFIEKITTASPPVTAGKRNVRVMYAAQTSVAPPTFVLFTNTETKLHFSYERFLENRLRETYGFLRQSDSHPDPRPRRKRDERRKTAAERAPDGDSSQEGPGSKDVLDEGPRQARQGRAPKAKRRPSR